MVFENDYPELSNRDCRDCQKYVYEDERSLVPLQAGGKWQERPPDGRAPCRPPVSGGKPLGCPKGTPENPRTLTLEQQITVAFYREALILGNVPDDPLCREIAATIKTVDDRLSEVRIIRGVARGVGNQVMGGIGQLLSGMPRVF